MKIPWEVCPACSIRPSDFLRIGFLELWISRICAWAQNRNPENKKKKPPIVIAESQKSPWDSFMLFVTKIPLAMSRKISRAPLRFVVWLGQKVVLRSCRGTRNPKCLARWMPFCRPVTGTEHPKRNLKTEKTEKPFPKKTSNCGDFLLKKTILEMVFNKNWGWWY